MPNRIPTVLLVDDDDSDRALIVKAAAACEEAMRVVSLRSGEELLRYLGTEGQYADQRVWPQPDLILLDMLMPGLNGWEVLEEISGVPGLRRIPIVALTHVERETDICSAYDLGVSAFIQKPLDFERLRRSMSALARFWFETAQLPSRRQGFTGLN